ncbi:hypothetical protein IPG41_02780 [Candidatus Peregrinibacteria bacterium]|nr:MAG: hypothetical protein IPG41_02780 [Candidatus Peregrinibacteria bacterium]
MSFFKLFKSKTFTNRQILAIGFVLAVLSMLSLGLCMLVFPLFALWMNVHGVVQLDLFFMAFVFVFLCATQALILFGFPLYYAQDQKSHMTGFRILLSALMWMLLLMLFIGTIFVQVKKSETIPVQNFNPSDLELSTERL